MGKQRVELPSYRDKAPEVARRFRKLYERPVAIEVCDLIKSFPGAQGDAMVLRDLDFKIRKGEIVCVVGPAGCGKTTLVRILAGSEYPSSGKVLLDQRPIYGPAPDRTLVAAGDTLASWLDVRHNITYGMRMDGHEDFGDEAALLHWMGLMGLRKYASNLPADLSPGMQCRVLIARALAHAAAHNVLLMDNPFTALEVQPRNQTQAYLLRIWRSLGMTVLLVTDNLDEAVYLADRVLVLSEPPSRILEIVEVPVPRPRSVKQFSDPLFLATRERLAELLAI